MLRKKLFLSCFLLSLIFFQNSQAKNKITLHQPKAIIFIVVDQLRSDQPFKWQEKLSKKGYQKLFKEGAYAPFAEYPALQNMTCPGHAMISTGSPPSQTGIPLNEWFDKKRGQLVYCSEDPDHGLSPRHLQGSTLGDEIKMRWPGSKTVSVALKDRSAIMLGGKSADAAYWYDSKKGLWTSSTYYKNSHSEMLNWISPTSPKKGETYVWKAQKEITPFLHSFNWGETKALGTPEGLRQNMEAAQKAFSLHQIGQDNNPDLFLISLSAHDYAGHSFGPDSPEVEDMTLYEDKLLSQFFEFLNKEVPGGLSNTWIILTSDHGVAPLVSTAKSLNLDSGIFLKSQLQDVETHMKKTLGPCKKNWIQGYRSLNFYLNSDCTDPKKVTSEKAKQTLKKYLETWEGVRQVLTSDELTTFNAPLERISIAAKLSYVPGLSGDVILIPKPFWFEEGPPTNHITSYTYDRTVPAVLWGKPFKTQILNQKIQVIDIAPTIARALQILAPAQSEGRVLHEVF